MLSAPPLTEDAVAVRREQTAALRREIDERILRSLDENIFLTLPYLGNLFGLTPFEEQVVLIALAPEIDSKYQRLFAYLQDDFSRRRPSVGLALQPTVRNRRRAPAGSRGVLRAGNPFSNSHPPPTR